MPIISRMVALGIALTVAGTTHLWVFARVENHALAFVGAAMAALPVIVLLRCHLDPCAG